MNEIDLSFLCGLGVEVTASLLSPAYRNSDTTLAAIPRQWFDKETHADLDKNERHALLLIGMALSRTIEPHKVLPIVARLVRHDEVKRLMVGIMGKTKGNNVDAPGDMVTLIRARAALTESVAIGAALATTSPNEFFATIPHPLNGRPFKLPAILAFAGSHQLSLDTTMTKAARIYQAHYWTKIVIGKHTKFSIQYYQNAARDERVFERLCSDNNLTPKHHMSIKDLVEMNVLARGLFIEAFAKYKSPLHDADLQRELVRVEQAIKEAQDIEDDIYPGTGHGLR